MIEINDEEFLLLQDFLTSCCGIEVPPDKRYLFKTRLNDLMIEKNYHSFKELLSNLVKADDDILQRQLIEFMTTNETSFFRDNHPFETLQNIIIPQLADLKESESLNFPVNFKIWSAGCSTGQEPYSISMILSEWLNKQKTFTMERISILATDVSNRAIEKARLGIYSDDEIDKNIMDSSQLKYFKKKDNNWEIDNILKKIINFKVMNLSHTFSDFTGNFDLIFCRNVIIYFSIELKKRIIDQFYQVLNPGGILVLGATESLYQISKGFETVYADQSIYYRVNK